jgi:quercetin dioxygenase-like cupin family protein
VISGPDTQAAIWFLGALSQLRITGEQTGGAFAVADHLAERGNASPVHVHDRDDETFFVLDGELRVFVGEEDHAAGPGTVVVLPRRRRHAYVVTSATARFLTLHTPAGFEQFATEVGEPARALTLPPPPAGPPDFAALAQAAARHQITILAPPPSPSAKPTPRVRAPSPSVSPNSSWPAGSSPTSTCSSSTGPDGPPPSSTPGQMTRAMPPTTRG